MADEKKSLSRNDAIFIYAAIKHLSTTGNQNKIKIYKTLYELGQRTNEVRKNTPLHENTLHHPTCNTILRRSQWVYIEGNIFIYLLHVKWSNF